MAIAVPLLMSAMGASSLAVTLTSIAFAVTGISAKINQAAAGVFGADLVQVANLFGSAVGATGGFGSMDPTSLDYTNSMDLASDAVTNAGEFGSLAQMAEAGDAANAVDYGAGWASQADGIAQMGGDAAEFTASVEPSNVIESIGSVGQSAGASPMEIANETQQAQSLIPTDGAASVQASGQSAAGTQAAGTQAAAPTAAGTNATAQNATAAMPGPAAPGQRVPNVMGTPPNPYAGGGAPTGQSFFGKLGNMVLDKDGRLQPAAIRGGLQLIGGIGQGYMQAKKMKQDQDQFEEKMRMYNQRPNIRSTR